MLVLTRKIGQQILVSNGTIKFKVLGVKRDMICLGVLESRLFL
ncbi:MAG: carbon storage regulator [Legionella sp.]|nr:carbon storage regulator [Legionella sp.]